MGCMEHLVHICHIYEHNSPHVSVLYDLGTVLARVRGGIKIVYISNFSQFRLRGGVIENQFFPKFKKIQNLLGGGGQENYGLFPQFGTFFFWMAPLIPLHLVNGF